MAAHLQTHFIPDGNDIMILKGIITHFIPGGNDIMILKGIITLIGQNVSICLISTVF